jgi:hypothetical protein
MTMRKIRANKGHLWGNREPDANHNGVANQVANDREQATQKTHPNHYDGIRQVHRDEKDRSESSVHGRNDDLRAHDGHKAAVQGGEAAGYLFASLGVQSIGRVRGPQSQSEGLQTGSWPRCCPL